MPDASFDAVIIGGGKEGLVIGCYLALNGMTVGLFEQSNELGGAACTVPTPAAGFRGNPHAEICAFWMSPAYYDFNLGEKGPEVHCPRSNDVQDISQWQMYSRLPSLGLE